jgi:hypothetical protein
MFAAALRLSLNKRGKLMPIRTALGVCALVLGLSATTARAGDNYGGFGPDDTNTQETGSDADAGGSTPSADQTLPWLQQQSQNQPDAYGDGLQQGAVDDGSDVDDASGH